MDKKFNLEHQYKLYLQRVNLDESKMHKQQKTQLKLTFMAACGQMLLLLRDDISELSEEEGVKVLEDLTNQVSKYVFAITKNQQGRNELCSCGSGLKYKHCCLNKGKSNLILNN